MAKTLYLFVDEAGDLGFSKNSTCVFVVCYIATENPETLRKCVNRLRKRLRVRKIYSKIGEFKFSRDDEYIRKKLLEVIARENLEVGYIVIDKKSVKAKLKDSPPVLYNYLVVHYILTNVLAKQDIGGIKFIIDKSLSKQSRERFDEYFRNKLDWKQLVEKGRIPPKYSITHENSQNDPCLQIVDYLAGAAFAKFEHGDSQYYNIIKPRIQFKNSWGEINW